MKRSEPECISLALRMYQRGVRVEAIAQLIRKPEAWVRRVVEAAE